MAGFTYPPYPLTDDPPADSGAPDFSSAYRSPSPSGFGDFEAPDTEELNRRLPAYEFVEVLGVGGMGAVYKARQPKLNRFVAIKILPRIEDDPLGFAQRFEREAQSMAQLSHPHIVGVHDFGETEDGQLYFVMEYIEGADLQKLIQTGELTTDHFFGWVPQVCDAIDYAHRNGIVHRDIKPANILINRDGNVKVADFGLAKMALPGQGESKTSLTIANVSMGTPDYAAPEQIDPEADLDHRADIYSVGIIMYQMLTGTLPRGAFKMPSEKNPDLDPRLDDVVLQAMQSEPEHRFSSASEISTSLLDIRTNPLKASPARKLNLPGPVSGAASRTRGSGPKPTPAKAAGAPTLPAKPKTKLAKKVAKAAPAHTPNSGRRVLIAVVATALSAVVSLFILLGRKDEVPPEADSKALADASPPSVSKSPPGSKSPPAGGGGSGGPNKALDGKDGKAAKPKPMVQTEPGGAGRPKLDGTAATDSGANRFGNFRNRPGQRLRSALTNSVGPRATANRLVQGNLVMRRRDNQAIGNVPLFQLPPDLGQVVDLKIGQIPLAAQAGDSFVLALSADGRVRAWGDNRFGQLELPPELGATRSIAIAAGLYHGLALTEDGRVIAWGQDDDGQSTVPDGLGKIQAIAAGGTWSLALTEDGRVIGWGDPSVANVPPDLPPVVALSGGFQHAVALLDNGQARSWGNLAQGNRKPLGFDRAQAVSSTFGNDFALLDNGQILGWGLKPAGRVPIPPEARATRLIASNDTVAFQIESGAWYVQEPGSEPQALPLLAPEFTHLVYGHDVVFAWNAESPTLTTAIGMIGKPAMTANAASPAANPASGTLPGTPDGQSSASAADGSGSASAAPTARAMAAEPRDQSASGNEVALKEALERVRELHERFLSLLQETVESPLESQVTQLNDFYLNALRQQQSQISDAGDLETALIFRNEADRIEAGGEILPQEEATSPLEGLLNLRVTYQAELGKFMAEAAAAETTLIEQYDGALENLQVAFTREEKLDHAVEVKAFRERFQAERQATTEAPAEPPASQSADAETGSLMPPNAPQPPSPAANPAAPLPPQVLALRDAGQTVHQIKAGDAGELRDQLAKAAPNDVIYLPPGRYPQLPPDPSAGDSKAPPVRLTVPDLVLIGDRARLEAPLVIAAPRIRVAGIGAPSIVVAEGAIDAQREAVRLGACRFTFLEAEANTRLEASHCVGKVLLGERVEAAFRRCTFVAASPSWLGKPALMVGENVRVTIQESILQAGQIAVLALGTGPREFKLATCLVGAKSPLGLGTDLDNYKIIKDSERIEALNFEAENIVEDEPKFVEPRSGDFRLRLEPGSQTAPPYGALMDDQGWPRLDAMPR